MLKTFWGWRDEQLPDGSVIWRLPAGRTFITTPGSALLFPSLCSPTGALAVPQADPPPDYCAPRTAMMPKRRRTRTQDRATRVATERHHNRQRRLTRKATTPSYFGPAPPIDPDDPPPF